LQKILITTFDNCTIENNVELIENLVEKVYILKCFHFSVIITQEFGIWIPVVSESGLQFLSALIKRQSIIIHGLVPQSLKVNALLIIIILP